jgi:hypothetical protein
MCFFFEFFLFRLSILSFLKKNCKFWEELMAYFPFTVILISDTTNRMKTQYVCIMKAIKQYNYGGFSVGITDFVIYEVYLWDDLTWHDMHTKFHE